MASIYGISELLARELPDHITRNPAGLTPICTPTGSGKTTSMAKVMVELAVRNAGKTGEWNETERPVPMKYVFATRDRPDRDAFAVALRKEIDMRVSRTEDKLEQAVLEDLKRRIYISKSNVDIFTEALYSCKSLKTLRKRLEAVSSDSEYKMSVKIAFDIVGACKQPSEITGRDLTYLQEAERNIRSTCARYIIRLVEAYKSDQKGQQKNLPEMLNTEIINSAGFNRWCEDEGVTDIAWILDLFIQHRIINSVFILLTHTKLYYPIASLIDGSLGLLQAPATASRCVSLLAIDESDSAYETILSAMIEEGSQGAIEGDDIFSSLSHLYWRLKETVGDKDAGKGLLALWSDPLSPIDPYKSIYSAYCLLDEYEVAASFTTRYKYVPTGVERAAGMFTGGDIISIKSYAKDDNDKDTVPYLVVEDENGKEGPVHNVLLKRFPRRSRIEAAGGGSDMQEIVKLSTQVNAARNRWRRALMNLGAAVDAKTRFKKSARNHYICTLIDDLALEQSAGNPERGVMARALERTMNQRAISKEAKGFLNDRWDSSFFHRGIWNLTMRDSDYHAHRTHMHVSEVEGTPERLIAAVSLMTHVVMMSATALVDTQGNFDFGWLRDTLGEQYTPLPDETLHEILRIDDAWIEARSRLYHPTVDVIKAGAEWIEDLPISEDCKKVLASKLMEAVDRIASKIIQKNATRAVNGMYEVVCAYAMFRAYRQQDGSRSMFCFFPYSFKDTDKDSTGPRERATRPEIKRLLKLVDKAFDSEADDDDDILVEFVYAKEWREGDMYSGTGYDSVREKLNSGGAAFVISAYPSSGFAKNIQFQIAEGEASSGRLVFLDEGVMSNERDYDCLYFSDVTNLIPYSKNADHALQDDAVSTDIAETRALFSQAKLFSRREISASECIANINSITSGGIARVRECPSFAASKARYLAQASGRVSRSSVRSLTPHFMLSPDIAKTYDCDALAGQPVTYEFKLINEAIREAQGSRADKLAAARDNRVCRLAEARNRSFARFYVDSLVYNAEWDAERIELYSRLRTTVLMNPCPDDETYRSMGIEKRAYLNAPEPTVKVTYLYDPKSERRDNNLEFASIVFDNKADYAGTGMIRGEVSPESTGLTIMSCNSVFSAWAHEKGIPLEWSPTRHPLGPTAARNVYKGVLGEEFVHAQIASASVARGYDDPLEELPDEQFELADFLNRSGNVAIDAKNWFGDPYNVDDLVEKAKRKIEKIGCGHFLYVNCIDTTTDNGPSRARVQKFVFNDIEDAVVIIPGIIDVAGKPMIERIEEMMDYVEK